MSELVLISPVVTRLDTASGPLRLLEISLGGTPRGLVVLLVGTDTPEGDVVETMNLVALEGYESLACPAASSQLGAVMSRAHERGWDDEQIGVVGVGVGGTLALQAARSLRLGAAVSFSPVPDISDVAARPALLTPWLGMFGADSAPAGLDDLRTALDGGSDVFSRLVTYPGVGADFHRRSATGVAFAASYDAWQRAIEWLNARVAARLTPAALAWRSRGR